MKKQKFNLIAALFSLIEMMATYVIPDEAKRRSGISFFISPHSNLRRNACRNRYSPLVPISF